MSHTQSSPFSLAGQRVVVIGGATGIGFEVAQLARTQGADVVIASSSAARVAAAVGRLDGAVGRTVDLRDEASVASFFETLGAFDHVAMTAGDWNIPAFVATRDLDLAQAREALTVRFWGALAVAKHCANSIAKTGSITLTGGLLTHRPRKGAPLPTAVGAAVENLARALAVDLAPVRVNAVSPGIVLTEAVLQQRDPAMLDALLAKQAVPRAARPAEAALPYVFSMVSTYVTGQVFPLDGGGLLG